MGYGVKNNIYIEYLGSRQQQFKQCMYMYCVVYQIFSLILKKENCRVLSKTVRKMKKNIQKKSGQLVVSRPEK